MDIIKKEILGHLLDSKYLFTFIVCSALILLSVYIGMRNYAADKNEYTTGAAEVRRELERKHDPDTPNTSPFLSSMVRVF